ncbi:TPA: 4Fe-4S ferredoxin [Candidatus Poribacteria bacterium]|nr:4Fe-4S ferredoxin [Candidatus Poribacteria bacterium]
MLRDIQDEQELYIIEICRGKVQGCRYALSDTVPLKDAIIAKFEEMRFSLKYSQKIDGRILHHHNFKIALSACPNACSQPQIKDFGVIAKVRPRRTDEECTFCKKCQKACLEEAISFDESGAIINYARCVECGSCTAQCPTKSLQEDRSGYTVLIGGKLGRHPQFGKELLEMADEDNVIHALQLCAQLLLNHDGKVMRFGDLVNLIELENIKDMLES